MSRVAIIGAGMAGIACARRLAEAGHAPVLVDKGRGIGGRVATRRAAGLHFDHGAQYVSAKSAEFEALMDGLIDSGAAADWQDGAERRHIVGAPGMSAIPKALAADLDVRQGVQVSQVAQVDGGWRLTWDGGGMEAAHVVLTVPAPQVAGLIGADHDLVRQIGHVRLAPCLTLMAAITGPAPFASRRDPDGALASIIADSSKPGRPEAEATAWTAQASPEFSTQCLEETPERMVELMVPLLLDALGAAPDRVSHAAAHRWRYARVTQALEAPFAKTPDGTLYLGGDWCIGARVEAAWQSGSAIAEDLLERLT
ncbi:hypothetical protein SAMN05421666_2178 [Roseovarius nanhaiticus]|uniref:Amine oxidase domain-containing protein n=1 Tax=Roseovarius nanhaiticus TaxID=573024 RepID=A0A1N7GX61_9RHOB|nr:FAD-dependent oxidoreductase [Roseovarius nanhaiticus]SEL21109.1 hypothetical protein SAMN05216208_3141 [Roseovarius nanhaiticus]SIS17130.1 hypothetical protein SAMN05421666_2178 [Roseovarius nanhaiticus]